MTMMMGGSMRELKDRLVQRRHRATIFELPAQASGIDPDGGHELIRAVACILNSEKGSQLPMLLHEMGQETTTRRSGSSSSSQLGAQWPWRWVVVGAILRSGHECLLLKHADREVLEVVTAAQLQQKLVMRRGEREGEAMEEDAMRDDTEDEHVVAAGLQLLFVRPGPMSDDEVEMHRYCCATERPLFHAERDGGNWHVNPDLDGLEVDYWYPISHSPRARRRMAVWS